MDHGSWSREANALTRRWFFDNNLRAVEALLRAHPERLSVPIEQLGLGHNAQISETVLAPRQHGRDREYGPLLSEILTTTSEVSGVSIRSLLAISRNKENKHWRHVCVYVMRDMTKVSSYRIGKVMRRVHTVIGGMLAVVIESPEDYEASIKLLRDRLIGANAPASGG